MKICRHQPLISLLIILPLTGLYAQWSTSSKPDKPLVLQANQHTEFFVCSAHDRQCQPAKPVSQNIAVPAQPQRP